MALLKPNTIEHDCLARRNPGLNSRITLNDIFNIVDLSRHKVEIELPKDDADDLLNYFLAMAENPRMNYQRKHERVIVTMFFTAIDQVRQPHLTERESTILQLIADGCTTMEISAQLFLSEGTVKREVRHIFDKLDVRNRSEAVAEAHKRKLIENL